MQAEGPVPYVVPTYEAPATVAFYHFLHGNVPGHQIDFIYQPNVPQGGLTQQHFSHLARLVKYIEPRSRSAPAFAIGNLSRDDTQYEPGRGGVAFIIGLRIRGAKDHAGRQDPPFCHALAAIGRHLDTDMLFDASVAFYRKVLADDDNEESQAQGGSWYHTYVQHAQNPDALAPMLRAYVAGFDELPAPPPSGLGLRWTIEGAKPPRRIVIMYDDGARFEEIAACAARIAAVLVESDIRWTAISTGREADVPGGMSIRFVPQNEVGPEEPDVLAWFMWDVPEDAGELAWQLFGAKEVRLSEAPEPRVGWRQLYGAHASEAIAPPPGMNAPEAQGGSLHVGLPAMQERPLPWAGEDAGEDDIPVDLVDEIQTEQAIEAATRPVPLERQACEKPDGLDRETAVSRRVGAGRKPGVRVGLLVGIAVALAIGGAVAAVAIGTNPSPGVAMPPAGTPPAMAIPVPAPAKEVRAGQTTPPEPTAPPPAAAATQAPAAGLVNKPLAGGSVTSRRLPVGAGTAGKVGTTGKKNAAEKEEPASVFAVP